MLCTVQAMSKALVCSQVPMIYTGHVQIFLPAPSGPTPFSLSFQFNATTTPSIEADIEWQHIPANQ